MISCHLGVQARCVAELAGEGCTPAPPLPGEEVPFAVRLTGRVVLPG